MAWVAVEKSGDEWVFEFMPIRLNKVGIWDIKYSNINCCELPKGSIAKLIGRELAWNDEPVELIETNQQDKGI